MFKLTTRQVTVAGVLGALTLVLGITRVGFIPVPTPAGAATFAHLPVILAGIVGGPVVGALVGLIFGATTFQFLGDLRVVIPARLLIGPIAFVVFRALGGAHHRALAWATPVAAAVGSLMNTVGTLSLAVAFGYIPLAGKTGAVAIGLMQGGPEALASAVVLTPIVYAVMKVYRQR